MALILEPNCHCCQYYANRTKKLLDECRQNGMEAAEIMEELRKSNSFDHCKSCWMKWHDNGMNDYEERGRFDSINKQ